MALPQKLKAARLSNLTLGTAIDDKIGELEGVICDILGITIDTDVTASAFSLNNSGQITKALVAQRAAGPVGWRFRDTTSGKEARIVVSGANIDVDENTGSEAVPVWVNRLRMVIATGALSGAIATTSLPGLCPAGDGNAAHYLDGTLTFSTPSAVSGPSVRVYADADQSLGTGGILPAGLQAIAFNQESWDTDNMHSNVTNNGYITCVTAGYYLFTGQVTFAASAVGYRLLRLIKDSSQTFGEASAIPVSDGHYTTMQVRGAVYMGVGSHVSLFAYQNSGGSLNSLWAPYGSPFLTAHKIA
jgi:hypothetical protein